MRAINHALTGGIIGLTVHNPVVALVAALVSHFVCDMIPHYGEPNGDVAGRSFALFLLWDAFLCVALVIVLYLSRNVNWLLAASCAFVATSPDLLWIRSYLSELQHRHFRETTLEYLLKRIQWFEKPIGMLVELAWFVGGAFILWVIL